MGTEGTSPALPLFLAGIQEAVSASDIYKGLSVPSLQVTSEPLSGPAGQSEGRAGKLLSLTLSSGAPTALGLLSVLHNPSPLPPGLFGPTLRSQQSGSRMWRGQGLFSVGPQALGTALQASPYGSQTTQRL